MTEVARTYGGALYELARDESLGKRLLEELTVCVGLFRENPELTRLLSTPSIPKAERREVLERCFGGRVHEYLLSFMKILLDRGSIGEMPGCAAAYRERFNEDNGILAVTAVTAVPMTPELRRRLESKLAGTFKKTIELTSRVDPAVLGGMRLELDGRRYDGTVRNRLDEIRRLLSGTVL